MHLIENGIVYCLQNDVKYAICNEYMLSIRNVDKSELLIDEEASVLVQLQQFNCEQSAYVDCKKSVDIKYKLNEKYYSQTTNTLGKALIKITSNKPIVKALSIDGDVRVLQFKEM